MPLQCLIGTLFYCFAFTSRVGAVPCLCRTNQNVAVQNLRYAGLRDATPLLIATFLHVAIPLLDSSSPDHPIAHHCSSPLYITPPSPCVALPYFTFASHNCAKLHSALAAPVRAPRNFAAASRYNSEPSATAAPLYMSSPGIAVAT